MTARFATLAGALALGAATIGGVATIGLTQARAQTSNAPPNAGMSGPAAAPGMNGAMAPGMGAPPPPPPRTGAYPATEAPTHRQATRYRGAGDSQSAEVERLNSESLNAARNNQTFVPKSNR